MANISADQIAFQNDPILGENCFIEVDVQKQLDEGLFAEPYMVYLAIDGGESPMVSTEVPGRWILVEPIEVGGTQQIHVIVRPLQGDEVTGESLDMEVGEPREIEPLPLEKIPVNLPDTTNARTGVKHNHKLKKLRFFCEHLKGEKWRRADEHTTLEVVPHRDGKINENNQSYDDQVMILFQGDGEKIPENLKLTKPDGTKVEVKRQRIDREGFGHFSFLCHAPKVSWNPFEKIFWTNYIKPSEYTVDGLPSPLTIKSYNPHQWTIRVAFPAFEKVKMGAKLTGNSGLARDASANSINAQEQSESELVASGWNPHTNSRQQFSLSTKEEEIVNLQERSFLYQANQEVGIEEKRGKRSFESITVKRDGMTVNIKAADQINALIALANNLYEIIKLIKDRAPKIGWYVDFDIAIFQGNFEIGFGWREHNDHRVYQWMSLGIDCALIKTAFELGIGISGYACKVQICGQVKGAFTIKAMAERTSPDTDTMARLSFKDSISGALVARFQAGYFFTFEASVGTELKMDGEISIENGRNLEITQVLEWTGITVDMSGSVASKGGNGGAKSKKSQTIVPGKKWPQYKWPEYQGPVYKPDKMSRLEILSHLEKKISEGWSIKVFEELEGLGNDIEWSDREIAGEITDHLDKRKYLRRDQNSIEALAHEIRQHLENISTRNPFTRFSMDKWIEKERFIDFVKRGELDCILRQYYDQCLLMQKDYGVEVV